VNGRGVVSPRDWSLEQQRDRYYRQGREGEVLGYLHRFCPLVMFVFVFCHYCERPGCRRNSNSAIPPFRGRLFLQVWKGNGEIASDLSNFREKFLKVSPIGRRFLSEAHYVRHA
jgi:hypothetical protein